METKDLTLSPLVSDVAGKSRAEIAALAKSMAIGKVTPAALALAVKMAFFAEQYIKAAKDLIPHGDGQFIAAAEAEGLSIGESTTYDYTSSPAWVLLKGRLEERSEPLKQRLALVQDLAKRLDPWDAPAFITDEETGEQLEVVSAKDTKGLKLTLK